MSEKLKNRFSLLKKQFADVGSAFAGNREFLFNPDSLGPDRAYPLDLSFTLRDVQFHFHPQDEHGIPYMNYVSVGNQYNPTRIAACGLTYYNHFCVTKSQTSRSIFLKMADWFMQGQGLWYYHFDWNDVRAPWLSCMSQGEGISILIRALILTGEERYLEQALRATEPFARDLASGGLRSELNGLPFLEEYPSPVPVHVLNGFLYALIGLLELKQVTAADPIQVEDFLHSLEVNIDRWDLGFWSAYDLDDSYSVRNACTVSYHNLHCSQLKYIGMAGGSQRILDTAGRWTEYCRSLKNRLFALQMKIRYRLQVKTQR